MAGPKPNGPWRQLRSAGRDLLGGAPALVPALLIVGLLACVLVPLPTVLVDLLLSLSLAGAVLLLVASLRVAKTSQFLGFPSLLLLLTLFRIALNVSTTRLILSQADAGRVVDTFSSFVVRNDLIVGVVMFAIITVVQYLVIARGAERVAEVAARFALDALPGRQQAIEADRRSGAISPREASERRAELSEQSSFYGRMDGAIRYVKGDAIAGLIIIAINLGGGLVIGMGRRGMSITESLEVYGALTIGDGLVAQIPALMLSLAAGVLVSRVDRVSTRNQTWLEAPMLLVPALMLGLLALIPGMPTVAFGSTALGLVAAALVLALRAPPQPRSEQMFLELALPAGVVLDSRQLGAELRGLQLRCSDATGLDIPQFVLRHDARRESAVDLRHGGSVLARVGLDGTGDDAVLVAGYRAVMRAAPQLLELDTLDAWTEQLRIRKPALVRTALEVQSSAQILAVCRGFLRERLPVPPMDALLSTIASDPRLGDDGERTRWLEIARVQLADHWLRSQLDALDTLGTPRWVRPTPDFEEAVLAGGHLDGGRFVFTATPSERQRWCAVLTEGDTEAEKGPVILLTRPRGRLAIAELMAHRSPHVPVISTAELESLGEARPEATWVSEPES